MFHQGSTATALGGAALMGTVVLQPSLAKSRFAPLRGALSSPSFVTKTNRHCSRRAILWVRVLESPPPPVPSSSLKNFSEADCKQHRYKHEEKV
jgi:hypothetical protein